TGSFQLNSSKTKRWRSPEKCRAMRHLRSCTARLLPSKRPLAFQKIRFINSVATCLPVYRARKISGRARALSSNAALLRGKVSDMEQQVVLITGGASGIGYAAASAWARNGLRVIISDINAKAGEAAEHALRTEGADVRFIRAD